MCSCNNIGFWTYQRCVKMITPQWKLVDIDICICQQIAELRYLWIETIESCCWHNKTHWYIAVKVEYIDKMLEIWYIQDFMEDWRRNIFYTK